MRIRIQGFRSWNIKSRTGSIKKKTCSKKSHNSVSSIIFWVKNFMKFMAKKGKKNLFTFPPLLFVVVGPRRKKIRIRDTHPGFATLHFTGENA
jgi:hypothetical protein